MSADFAPGLGAAFELPARDLGPTELAIRGRCPSRLAGTWAMNGPARFRVGGVRYRHWLDGDGAVAALHLGAGRATFVRRFVQSRKVRHEHAAEQALYRGFGTRFAGDRLQRGVMLESPVNVSVHRVGGDLLAFGEQGLPWALDPVTLETRGEHTFGGALNPISPFSAHPHFDPVSGEMIAFGVSFAARDPLIQLYRFDAGGRLALRARVPIGLPASIHDFAISPRYAIFWVAPYLLDFQVLHRGGSVLDALDWQPRRGSRVIVARRADGAVVAEVAVGSGYCLHAINAFEDGHELTLDLVELDRPVYDSYLIDELLADAPRGRPVRLRIDLARAAVIERRELGFDLAPDFPAIDPAAAGTATAELWLLGTSRAGEHGRKFFDRLAHLDWNGGEDDIWAAPAGAYLAGEPVLAGTPERGAVLCPVLETRPLKSFIGVFEPRSIAAGPVARIDLPEPIAPGFHASWAPARS